MTFFSWQWIPRWRLNALQCYATPLGYYIAYKKPMTDWPALHSLISQANTTHCWACCVTIKPAPTSLSFNPGLSDHINWNRKWAGATPHHVQVDFFFFFFCTCHLTNSWTHFFMAFFNTFVLFLEHILFLSSGTLYKHSESCAAVLCCLMKWMQIQKQLQQAGTCYVH